MELLHELGIEPLLLLAQVVNFLILLGLLWKFLYKPLTKALRDRRNTIEKSLSKAKKIEEDLKSSKVRAEEIVTQANQQAEKLKTKNQLEIADTRRERMATVEKEATQVFNRAEESIKEEKKRMENEVREQAIDLVSRATEKVLQKKLDPKEHKELISDSIQEVSKSIS